MFGLGFFELCLLAMVALVVLGPEKLPVAAKKAGMLYGKLRRTLANMQNEIETELNLAEARKQMQEELAKIREAEKNMQAEMKRMEKSMQEIQASVNLQQEQDELIIDETEQQTPLMVYQQYYQHINQHPEKLNAYIYFLSTQVEKQKRLLPAPFLPILVN